MAEVGNLCLGKHCIACPKQWRYVRSFGHAQFLGGTSLLTGPTDEHWKLVRKAVAPAFSQGNMR